MDTLFWDVFGCISDPFENGVTSFLLVLVWNIKGALSGSLIGVSFWFS